MKVVTLIVSGMFSLWFLSSCASRQKAKEVKVGLNINDVFEAIESAAPPSVLVRYSGDEKIVNDKKMRCIEVVDLKAEMSFLWVDEKGNRYRNKIGRQGVKFWVSESGDYRPAFVFSPDRGSVFFSSEELFVYAVKSSFQITEEDRRKYQSMLESARQIKGDEVDLTWKTWNRDIKQKLSDVVD